MASGGLGGLGTAVEVLHSGTTCDHLTCMWSSVNENKDSIRRKLEAYNRPQRALQVRNAAHQTLHLCPFIQFNTQWSHTLQCDIFFPLLTNENICFTHLARADLVDVLVA